MTIPDMVDIIREEILKVMDHPDFREVLSLGDMKLIADQAARFAACRIADTR